MKRMIPREGAALLTAQLAQATTTSVQGEAYIAECKAAGVPRPPVPRTKPTSIRSVRPKTPAWVTS